MARELACLFYPLLKHGQQYVAKGMQYYEPDTGSSKFDWFSSVPSNLA